jgi:hypothetical protein
MTRSTFILKRRQDREKRATARRTERYRTDPDYAQRIRDYQRAWRANPVQIEKKRALNRKYWASHAKERKHEPKQKPTRASREDRLERVRERMRLHRANRTPDQIEQDRAKARARYYAKLKRNRKRARETQQRRRADPVRAERIREQKRRYRAAARAVLRQLPVRQM